MRRPLAPQLPVLHQRHRRVECILLLLLLMLRQTVCALMLPRPVVLHLATKRVVAVIPPPLPAAAAGATVRQCSVVAVHRRSVLPKVVRRRKT